MKQTQLFTKPTLLALAVLASLSGCANIDNSLTSDLECCCVRPAPEPIIKTVEVMVPAPAVAAVVIKPGDKDSDGVYDENDQCPSTEAGKKVDQRGCPEILLSMSGINFNTDSSKILPGSEAQLASAVKALQDSVGVSILVEGYADSTAGSNYNQLLSERRAKTVREYLIAKGIEPSRLVAVGHGENSPIASNNTKDGRYKNRRVDLRTVGTAFLKEEK